MKHSYIFTQVKKMQNAAQTNYISCNVIKLPQITHHNAKISL